MEIKSVAEYIKSFIETKDKKQISSEKSNFQEILEKIYHNNENSPSPSSLLWPPSISFPEQINKDRPLMIPWEIKGVENILHLLEKYKDDLLDPQVSPKELKEELIVLLNKTEEFAQILKSQGGAKDLGELLEAIKTISQGEIEKINRGNYH